MWVNSSGRLSKQRHIVRVPRLDRLRRLRKGAAAGTKKMVVGVETYIQMKNLKLYMENQFIMEANERLREKALLLHQENQTLLAQLQNKSSDTQNQR
ncbi:protein LITTLE ZIPPER 1-like [Hibiscus syriacus]|uniref:protein LITTLE ZIPPER 1-like n=1 Tax=Hibiscus syriacus TaxID=106335 RepID=UPI001924E5B2|nr:protein LITTLE ZIPPER 1-like [Hibiscus syriacus]